ncbi:MAG: STAS/SEC14 domain-containing protein [Fibrobacteria bacterium]|nr:STAS/SEC14 domain-containing protein [Fibrobacteria bacterium]
MNSGENKMWLDEKGILNFAPSGIHDKQQAQTQKEMVLTYLCQVTGSLNCIIDLNNVGRPSLEARKVYNELSNHPQIGKLAIVGMAAIAQAVATIVFGAPSGPKMSFFKTREEAIKWLNS